MNYSIYNCLDLGSGGLSVLNGQPGCKPVLSFLQSATIERSGDGSKCNPLGLEVKISEKEGNTISVEDDGLYSFGGSGGIINVDDTNTVSLSLISNILTGNIKIDPSSTAPVSVTSNGLKVDKFTQTPITVADTSTIDLTSSGTDNHSISAAVKISSDSGNSIEIRSNGLYYSGGNSYGIKDMFRIGDPGKPAAGALTYTSSGLIGKSKMDVNIEIQGIVLPYNDSNQRSFILDAEPSITGTITLNAQFDTDENVRVYW